MKKLIVAIGFLALIIIAPSFKEIKPTQDKASATVEQKQGLYIFIMSKPSLQYDYLGSVKKGLALTGQPEEMINSMIKKVKKEYPKADGIIFTSIELDKADAIIFKTQ